MEIPRPISQASVKTTTDFHDIIADKTEVYYLGASRKDAGKKRFGVAKTEEKNFAKSLVNKVRKKRWQI